MYTRFVKKVLPTLVFVLILFFTVSIRPQEIFSQERLAPLSQPPKEEFVKGRVEGIAEQGIQYDYNGNKNPYQKLKVKLTEGNEAGKIIEVQNGGEIHISENQLVKNGELLVLTKITSPDSKVSYFISDKYRLGYLPYLLILFALFVVFIAGIKGIGSLLGIVISLGVIGIYIVPNIIHGSDPLMTSIIGSIIILVATTYLAHGLSKQTTVALVSTFFALIFTAVLSILVVNLAKLTGMGNEEAYSLQLSQATASINLQGLLLGGIIIGTLGALNDITTTQSAAVFEFAKHNRNAGFEKLFKAGFSVGREHVVSLVNTLVLAYAGSSLAVFIYFVLNPSNVPVWVILNGEMIFEEIVTMVTGGIGLISVVPVVTFIAAVVAMQDKSSLIKKELA